MALPSSERPLVRDFKARLQSKLDIGDRQIFFRDMGRDGRVFINFYNVPAPISGSSAEAENNRLALDVFWTADGKVHVELAVRGPSFGTEYKLRSKATTLDGAVKHVADYLNHASKKPPYGFTFDRMREQEPDTQAARELSLYIENEYSLVGAPNSQGKAIEKNLLKKIQSGTFDLARSEDAWMHLMESGAKKYAKEYSSGVSDWSNIFNKPTRELVAHEFAVSFFEEHGKAKANQSTPIDDEAYLAYKSEFLKEFQRRGGPPGTSYWQDLAIANCLTWGIPAKTAADHFTHWWFSLRTVTSTSAQLLRYLERQRGVPAGRTRGP